MKKFFALYLALLVCFISINVFAATGSTINNQSDVSSTKVWYWEDQENSLTTVAKTNLDLYNFNVVNIKTIKIYLASVNVVDIKVIQLMLSEVNSIDISTVNLILNKISMIDVSTVNLILNKINMIDVDTISLMLSKANMIDVNTISLMLNKVNMIDVNTISMLINKLSIIGAFSGSASVDILLANIDKVSVIDVENDIYIRAKLKRKILEMLANGPKYLSTPTLMAYLMKAKIDVWSDEWTALKDIKISYRFGKFNFGTMKQWADKSSSLPTLDKTVYVPFPKNIRNTRIISEVKTPSTVLEAENQVAELDYLHDKWGYNGILIVSEGEDPIYLEKIAKEYKSKGWVVGFTYGGQETDIKTPYIPINKMEAIMQSLAPNCDFFILTWRVYTGSHWYGNEEYLSYVRVLSCLARIYNPNIVLIGDKYFTLNKSTLEVKMIRTFDIPNISGYMISNLGTTMENTRELIEKNVQGSIAMPIVVGPTYYYRYFKKFQIIDDKKMIRDTCNKIESNCLKSGIIPLTITLGGDGSGERGVNSDSLTKTKWRE